MSRTILTVFTEGGLYDPEEFSDQPNPSLAPPCNIGEGEEYRDCPPFRYAIEVFIEYPDGTSRWAIDTHARKFDNALKALKMNADYERVTGLLRTWRLRDEQTGNIIMGDIL